MNEQDSLLAPAIPLGSSSEPSTDAAVNPPVELPGSEGESTVEPEAFSMVESVGAEPSILENVAPVPQSELENVGPVPQSEPETTESAWTRMGREVLSGVQTLVSAAVYATLIVTFGFQVARVDGLSMAPTLEDHDRLIVNKLVYEIGEPRPGDIVMLYYPLNPEKMFVKRVIAREGDTVRIVDGRVYVNDVPLHDDYVPAGVPQPRRLGPAGHPAGLLLRDGRPSEQQLRQPPLGTRAEEIHRRQGEGPLVAAPGREDLLSYQPSAISFQLSAISCF